MFTYVDTEIDVNVREQEVTMQVHTVHQLGALLRDRRQALGLSQSAVAATAQVSRPTIAALEHGKPTAEIGLCLRVLDALGLEVQVVARREPDHPAGSATDRLDRLLHRLREP
jgi:y4mF family transcriptional regulator